MALPLESTPIRKSTLSCSTSSLACLTASAASSLIEISILLPRIPPAKFISSIASLAPCSIYVPYVAHVPLLMPRTPIFIVSLGSLVTRASVLVIVTADGAPLAVL
jgi:hypothetical protein